MKNHKSYVLNIALPKLELKRQFFRALKNDLCSGANDATLSMAKETLKFELMTKPQKTVTKKLFEMGSSNLGLVDYVEYLSSVECIGNQYRFIIRKYQLGSGMVAHYLRKKSMNDRIVRES